MPDPYRWLEDDVRKSAEVAAWVAAQNKVTYAYLDAIPQREAIRKRAHRPVGLPAVLRPVKDGGRYFFSKNDGLQNQAVLFTADRLDAEPRVLIDPNKWSKDGTVALGRHGRPTTASTWPTAWPTPGPTGRRCKVLDMAAGKPLSDELKWVKFSGASWTADGRGFFYSRYPEPAKGAEFQGLNMNQKLYYHRARHAAGRRRARLQAAGPPGMGLGGGVSDDGRYLVIRPRRRDHQPQYRVDVQGPQRALRHGRRAHRRLRQRVHTSSTTTARCLYFRTDLNAPKGKVVAIDLRTPGQGELEGRRSPRGRTTWKPANIVGNLFACSYLQGREDGR